MEGQALAVIEADANVPLLPGELIAADREGGALGLDDLVRLGGGPGAGSKFGVVFTGGL